ncbi:MAG: pirin family protein, partial [Candidatus Hodarchaeota archaeon]
VHLNNDVKARIICGEVNGIKGPVQDIVTDPEYLDVTIAPRSEFEHHVKQGYTVFAFVIKGKGYFDQNLDQLIHAENLVIYEDGEKVRITTNFETVRFLLISGKPIGEPVAWYGPIVMNTKEELRLAFEEYQNGTFLKYSNSPRKAIL